MPTNEQLVERGRKLKELLDSGQITEEALNKPQHMEARAALEAYRSTQQSPGLLSKVISGITPAPLSAYKAAGPILKGTVEEARQGFPYMRELEQRASGAINRGFDRGMAAAMKAIEPVVPQGVLDVAGDIQPMIAGAVEGLTGVHGALPVVPQGPSTTTFGPYKAEMTGEEATQLKQGFGQGAGLAGQLVLWPALYQTLAQTMGPALAKAGLTPAVSEAILGAATGAMIGTGMGLPLTGPAFSGDPTGMGGTLGFALGAGALQGGIAQLLGNKFLTTADPAMRQAYGEAFEFIDKLTPKAFKDFMGGLTKGKAYTPPKGPKGPKGPPPEEALIPQGPAAPGGAALTQAQLNQRAKLELVAELGEDGYKELKGPELTIRTRNKRAEIRQRQAQPVAPEAAPTTAAPTGTVPQEMTVEDINALFAGAGDQGVAAQPQKVRAAQQTLEQGLPEATITTQVGEAKGGRFGQTYQLMEEGRGGKQFPVTYAFIDEAIVPLEHRPFLTGKDGIINRWNTLNQERRVTSTKSVEGKYIPGPSKKSRAETFALALDVLSNPNADAEAVATARGVIKSVNSTTRGKRARNITDEEISELQRRLQEMRTGIRKEIQRPPLTEAQQRAAGVHPEQTKTTAPTTKPRGEQVPDTGAAADVFAEAERKKRAAGKYTKGEFTGEIGAKTPPEAVPRKGTPRTITEQGPETRPGIVKPLSQQQKDELSQLLPMLIERARVLGPKANINTIVDKMTTRGFNQAQIDAVIKATGKRIKKVTPTKATVAQQPTAKVAASEPPATLSEAIARVTEQSLKPTIKLPESSMKDLVANAKRLGFSRAWLDTLVDEVARGVKPGREAKSELYGKVKNMLFNLEREGKATLKPTGGTVSRLEQAKAYVRANQSRPHVTLAKEVRQKYGLNQQELQKAMQEKYKGEPLKKKEISKATEVSQVRVKGKPAEIIKPAPTRPKRKLVDFEVQSYPKEIHADLQRAEDKLNVFLEKHPQRAQAFRKSTNVLRDESLKVGVHYAEMDKTLGISMEGGNPLYKKYVERPRDLVKRHVERLSEVYDPDELKGLNSILKRSTKVAGIESIEEQPFYRKAATKFYEDLLAQHKGGLTKEQAELAQERLNYYSGKQELGQAPRPLPEPEIRMDVFEEFLDAEHLTPSTKVDPRKLEAAKQIKDFSDTSQISVAQDAAAHTKDLLEKGFGKRNTYGTADKLFPKKGGGVKVRSLGMFDTDELKGLYWTAAYLIEGGIREVEPFVTAMTTQLAKHGRSAKELKSFLPIVYRAVATHLNETKGLNIPLGRVMQQRNFKAFDSVKQWDEYLNVVAQTNKGIQAQAAKRVTLEEMKQQAAEIALPVEVMTQRWIKPGLYAQFLARKEYIQAFAEEQLTPAFVRYMMHPEDNGAWVAYKSAERWVAAALKAMAGDGREMGRAINIHRIPVGTRNVEEMVQARMSEAFGDSDQYRYLMAKLMQTPWWEPGVLTRFIAMHEKVGAMQAAYEIAHATWVNGLFTFPTHVINLENNMLQGTLGIFARKPIATTIHGIISELAGTPRQMFYREIWNEAQHFYWKAWPKAREAAFRSFLTEIPQMGEAKLNPALNRRFRLSGGLVTGTRFQGTFVEKALDWLGRGVRAPGDALQAADDGIKTLLYEAKMDSLAMRTAMVEQRANNLSRKDMLEIYYDLIQDPTEDMIREAMKHAEYTTLTQASIRLHAAVDRLFPNLPVARALTHGFVDWTVPFARIMTNSMVQGFEHSPLYAPRILARVLTGNLKPTSVEFAEETAKVVLGTLIGIGVWQAVKNKTITGGGPSDPIARREWLRENSPYAATFRIPGVKEPQVWQYGRYEGVGTALGLMADAFTVFQEAQNTDRLDPVATAGTLISRLGRNILNKNFSLGLVSMLRGVVMPEIYGDQWFELLAASTVPGTVSSIARARDPYLRQPKSVKEAFFARIPRYREEVDVIRDEDGQPVVSIMYPVERAVSPTLRFPYKVTPGTRMLDELGIAFANPPHKSGRVALNKREYGYVEGAGKEWIKYREEKANDPVFRRKGPVQQIKLLKAKRSAIFRKHRAKAMKLVKERYLKAGITVKQYRLLKQGFKVQLSESVLKHLEESF